MCAYKCVLVYPAYICSRMLHPDYTCAWAGIYKNVHAQSVAKVMPHVVDDMTNCHVVLTAGFIY